jgi:hypothetical protein
MLNLTGLRIDHLHLKDGPTFLPGPITCYVCELLTYSIMDERIKIERLFMETRWDGGGSYSLSSKFHLSNPLQQRLV